MKAPILGLALLAAALPVHPADLVVEVDGIRNESGEIRLVLFAADDFLDFTRVRARAQVPARVGQVQLRLSGLPGGRYSFAIAHDENGNGRGDRNLIGIPLEGVAASNNARGRFGPPSAAAAAFVLGAAGTRQRISLIYY